MPRAGYARSFVIGATFAAAWSPCIGPILGVVLTLAAASGTALHGGLLLVAYSLGLGVWFVAAGAGFGWLVPRLRRIQRFMPRLMVISGALFIVFGAGMLLGEFSRLNRSFQALGFLFGRTAEAEAALVPLAGGLLGPGVALFGGVVSFLSPCVLPLVPVYIANLAGEAAIADPTGVEGGRASRRLLTAHALAFVLGFTVVFAVLGASAGLVGRALFDYLDLVTRAGGALMVVFGLQLTGLIRIPYLERTYQLRTTGT